MEHLEKLALAIAEVGVAHKAPPPAHRLDAFAHFFDGEVLDESKLDERDGGCTRRELLLRVLILTAVLDQGPDLEGVREMMVEVVNNLYRNEIRIFHRPLDFFKEINISVEQIWNTHETVKSDRSKQWAEDNQSSAGKYNLYLDSSKQTLNYAIFRWGVPLALPYLLGRSEYQPETALADYLENYGSAEKMCRELKRHPKFGLGKAIGDKACHLFAKWMVSTLRLARKQSETKWSPFSYELPFDSNAGRVLWRTGYLNELADKSAYEKENVIQVKQGKKGSDYIRVTNMRGMPVSANVPPDLQDIYKDICVNHLQSHTRAPRKVEIQRFQHALLWNQQRKDITVESFDDGLIEIGRNYCFNHESPKCEKCPVNRYCEGYQSDKSLIDDYRT